MPVLISMLRAVNLASHNRISMESLRTLYASLGFEEVRTYIQSGNIVFRAAERNLSAVAKRIEDAIEKNLGFRSAVILRSSSDLRKVIAANPFANRPEVEPNRLLVLFLAADPERKDLRRIAELEGPEELHAAGREVYIYFPNGMARPKISPALVEKALNTPATGRNWNTVKKLVEIAEELERS
jgi:uncharacterized protein (DUF1697 family)